MDAEKLAEAENAVLDKVIAIAKRGDADDAEIARDLAEAVALLKGDVHSA